MSLATYVTGAAMLAVVAAACGVGGRGLRRRVAPTLDGADALLATTVLALALFFGMGQAIGTVGLFSRWPLVVGALVVGAGGWAVGRQSPAAPRTVDDVREVGIPRPELAVAAVLTGLTLAQYWARTVATLRYGPTAGDTLIYHLPFAARFVQDGSITALHQVAAGGVTTPFNPANPELVHAAGMLAFRSDLLSPFVNIAWLAAVVLAAWAAGRSRGAGALAGISILAVAGAPLMIGSHAGGANTDLAAVFFVMAAVVLLLDGRPGTFPMAALAAGMALGVKVSVAALVAMLTVVAVITAGRDRRARAALVWGAVLVVGGGYWYVVNLARVGNPFPGVPLGVGPIAFPRPQLPLLQDFGYSVAHYATDTSVWRRWFIPGLHRGLGAVWPAPLLVAVGGAGWAAATRGRPAVRGLGLATIAAVVVYLLTPTTALGPEGSPYLFLGNLRYLMPALAVGLLVAALLAGAAPPGVRRGALVVLAGIALVPAVSGADAVWRGRDRVAALVVALVAVGSMALVGVARRRGSGVVTTAAVSAVLALAVIAAGWRVEGEYRRVRYASTQPGMPAAFDWARHVHGARIGIAGFFQQYPLYGLDLSNRVQYIGRAGAHGGFFEVGSCAAWRRAVHAGRYRYVVTAAAFATDKEEPVQARWTRSDPSASEVLHSGLASVFRLDGRFTTEGCAAS